MKKHILLIDRFRDNFSTYTMAIRALCKKEFGIEVTVFCTDDPSEGREYFEKHCSELDFVLVGAIACHLVPTFKAAFDGKPIFGMASLRQDRQNLFLAGCTVSFDKLVFYVELGDHLRKLSQAQKTEAALL